MPRQTGISGQNNFVKGLVTETTALRFPEDAATDCRDAFFSYTGAVSFRPGFDLEPGYSTLTNTSDQTFVTTDFLWESVAGDGDRSFLVRQEDATIRFFDVSDNVTPSAHNVGSSISLSSHIPAGSLLSPAAFPCQYAAGTGRLIIVSRAIKPLLVEYASASNSFTVTEIDIRIRDFTGLNSNQADNTRVTSTVANLISTNPAHYYNLLNQSWFIADALAQWDAALTTLPSNRDYVGLYRASTTDAFDATRVTANTPGTRLAPKGHFILSAFCPDYTQAMTDEGFTATITNAEVEMTNAGLGPLDLVGNATGGGGLAAAFDSNTNQAGTACASSTGSTTIIFAGRRVFGANITKALVHGSNNEGYTNAAGTPNITLTLYAKNGDAPTSATDGTIIGTLAAFADTSDEHVARTITSTDTVTQWTWVWVKIDSASAGTMRCAELRLFTQDQQDALYCTVERPQAVEFFASRVWYAGTNFGKLNGNIYFTQIIEKPDQFGKCYQKNDPASEDFTDLLADDGGVVTIPEIAQVVRLFSYQGALLVIATNGIWMIAGGTNGGFLANDYTVKKLSNEGSNAPLSLLSNKGVPSWWGQDGIYSIQFDSNYQSFNVQNITIQFIKGFIEDIPEYNRRFVKGAFDAHNLVGYWLYSTDTLTVGDEYRYNSVLTVNAITGAYAPYSISVNPNGNGPEVRGIVYVRSPTGNDEPVVKFTTTIFTSPNERVTYSEIYNDNHYDWGLYAMDSGDSTQKLEYTPFIITGYNLDSKLLNYQQGNYVIVYTENDPCASCYVQGVYDFATTGNTGKWSTKQQIVNPCLDDSVLNFRRVKIRGKGRALQLKFTGVPGKPCTIVGWGIWKTINQSV